MKAWLWTVSHVTRRALKLTNLLPFGNWKIIVECSFITCNSLENAFSASGNPTGPLIWRTCPAQSFRTPPLCCDAHGGQGSSWGRAESTCHSPLRLSRERASRLITNSTEFHGRSHWDWKANDDCQRAGEIIARVTRKSPHHRSILGIIRSVPLWGMD